MQATLPPHSPDAERALLGALLNDADNVRPLCERAGVTVDWFFEHDHALTFRAILSLAHVDLVTVGESLKRRGHEDLSGMFLESLVDACPASAMAGSYIEILREKFRLRRLRENGMRLAEAASAGDVGAVNDAVQAIGELEIDSDLLPPIINGAATR
jgi:replicative DNA helicase